MKTSALVFARVTLQRKVVGGKVRTKGPDSDYVSKIHRTPQWTSEKHLSTSKEFKERFNMLTTRLSSIIQAVSAS